VCVYILSLSVFSVVHPLAWFENNNHNKNNYKNNYNKNNYNYNNNNI